MKAGFISLGCSKNLVDTEVMLGILEANDIEITKEPKDADILIVNTCSFIESAKVESFTTIMAMGEYKKTGKCKSLIMTGCLSQRYADKAVELLKELPEIDAIVGTGAYPRIMEAINETIKEKKKVVLVDMATDMKELISATTPRVLTTPSFSAYIKIAEGCDHRCAYCAIPKARGKYLSRSIEDIVAEVKNLADKGVIEFNLIAQDTTNYGRDIYGEPSLPKLLKEICKIEKVKWVRIQYSYPHTFSDELIDLMAKEDKICKYVDMPLQHAHDGVLKRMYRSDRREYIENLIAKLREKIPNIAIRSTFIVGFPGETQAEYESLRDFLQKQKFHKVGIFSYSKEEDTAAFDMPNQVDDDVKQERYHDLMAVQAKISEEINQSMEGTILDVLVEGVDRDEKITFGRSYREAPEVDGKIYIENDTKSNVGDIVKVKILQGFDYDMVGELV